MIIKEKARDKTVEISTSEFHLDETLLENRVIRYN